MNRVIGTTTTGAVIYDDSDPYEVDTKTTSGTTYTRYENTTLPQLITKVVVGDTTVYTRSISLWSARAGN